MGWCKKLSVANNLRKMKKGIYVFYHSNIGKEIVGIVRVIIEEAFMDPTDKTKKFVAGRFKAKLKHPVSLENIKKSEELKELPLIRQGRLSVMPIDTKHWKIILNMSKIA